MNGRKNLAFHVALVVSAVSLALVGPAAVAEELPAKVTYVDHVQPIFRQHCFACHGPDTQKNDLALNTYAAAMTGGASGEVLLSGDPDSSYLFMLVTHELEPAMPPGGAKLSDPELALIKAWIAGGLLEQGDSVARKPSKPKVAAFTPSADNHPEGEPAMPQGLLREPVLHVPHRGAPTALAASPWAPVAAVGASYQISLYNTDTGELLGILPFVEGSPYALRFSRDGSLLLAGGGRSGARGVVALFDVKTGRRLATVGDELDAVLAADIRSDHSLVALGGPRKAVRVYRVADGSLAYEITKHTDWITALEFSPDGKLLATADRGGGLLLWDAETGRERGDLRGHAEQITSISWRGDSAVLASASEDDTVRLWQTDSQQLKSWPAHGSGASSVQFARDGQLVSAGRDQLVKLWKADGAALRDVTKLDDLALAARFTHDGQKIVASDWTGNVRIVAAGDGSALAALNPNPPTLAERLAAAQAEAAALRQTAQQAHEQLALAQQQVAAAAKTLEQAQADAQAKTQLQAESMSKLGAAEQKLSAVVSEKEAYEKAAAEIAAQLVAAKEELQTAESEAAGIKAARDESQVGVDAQRAVVDDLAAQLKALQAKFVEAQAALKALAEAHAAKEQAAAGADARVADVQSKLDDFGRRQAELEAVQQLRTQFQTAK
ncbi:MAG: c-type cytochrome [Pirellulales bacterium]|nr:c-type cytochrome [Pirellulales bacterium]